VSVLALGRAFMPPVYWLNVNDPGFPFLIACEHTNLMPTADYGGQHLLNLGGSAQAQSSSGSIELNNVAGDVKVSTNSGQIRATALQHLREATSSSGSMSLEGTFTDEAHIQANSGSVNLKLLPESAVQLDVKTGSGSINPQGLINLTGGSTARNKLTGALGTPAGVHGTCTGRWVDQEPT